MPAKSKVKTSKPRSISRANLLKLQAVLGDMAAINTAAGQSAAWRCFTDAPSAQLAQRDDAIRCHIAASTYHDCAAMVQCLLDGQPLPSLIPGATTTPTDPPDTPDTPEADTTAS